MNQEKCVGYFAPLEQWRLWNSVLCKFIMSYTANYNTRQIVQYHLNIYSFTEQLHKCVLLVNPSVAISSMLIKCQTLSKAQVIFHSRMYIKMVKGETFVVQVLAIILFGFRRGRQSLGRRFMEHKCCVLLLPQRPWSLPTTTALVSLWRRLVALGSELMLLYQKDYFWQVPSDNLSEYCNNEIKIALILVKLFCLVMYSLCMSADCLKRHICLM